jgi:hypothetical protein
LVGDELGGGGRHWIDEHAALWSIKWRRRGDDSPPLRWTGWT